MQNRVSEFTPSIPNTRSAMKTLTVVCPVYNEAEVIERFYIDLKPVLIDLADQYAATIMFVVDPGTDATLDILKCIAKKDSSVQIIALSARFGHQMALVAGIDHCDSDVVIMMDSDLQHPPDMIPEMLREFENGY